MSSIQKHTCPTCGQSVNERSISLFDGMVETLWNVFQWCERKQVHEFVKKDVKHLITSDVVSANFAYWRWFGGLAYNPDDVQGHYGLNMERCREFFANRLKIPTRLWKNPLMPEGERVKPDPDSYATCDNIPNLFEFLDRNKNYIARYREPQGSLF